MKLLRAFIALDGLVGSYGWPGAEGHRDILYVVSHNYLCTRYSLTHPIIPESYPSNWHLCLLFICCVVALSPFQQRAFKGVVSGYLFNGYTRIAAQVPYFFVPLATGAYAEFLPSLPVFFSVLDLLDGSIVCVALLYLMARRLLLRTALSECSL